MYYNQNVVVQMNIGIDIDNVISNFNEVLLNEFFIHDKDLRNNGIINTNAEYITRGMFDWTKEELDEFYITNIERIAKKLVVIDGAKEYIDKLRNNGYNIFIITGRDNGEYTNPYEMTKKWLNENSIYYDKLILTNAYDAHSKTKECLKNHIDIMIDDSKLICEDCVINNITPLLMDTPYNKDSNITRVHNWEEIYEFITEHEKN